MKRLFLIRGIPGSGKSTLASILAAAFFADFDVEHCEADQFFTNNRGEYLYDKSKVSDAHFYCIKRATNAMEADIPIVIVSNTFTQEWQIAPYRELAEKFDYSVQEILCLGKFGSIHEVPMETIQRMKKNLFNDLAKEQIG